MNIDPIKVQLAGCGFKSIDSVAGLDDIATRPGALPAGFIVIESERSSDVQSGSGVFEQIDTIIFGVVIVVSTGAAQHGLPGADIETLKEATKLKLRGWLHPDTDRPAAYRGARLISVGAGRVSALLRFETTQRVRIVRAGI